MAVKGSFKQASATGEDFKQSDPEVAQLSELVKSLLAEQEALRQKLADQADEIQSFKDRPPSTSRQQTLVKKTTERSKVDNSKLESNIENKNTQSMPPKPGSSTKLNHTERLRIEREKKKREQALKGE